MKILCPVKKTIDYQVKVRINDQLTDVVKDNVPMSMNPFDEIAVEEAVRWKEQGLVTEIITVTIGKADCTDILRKTLAHGADKAILIETEQNLRPKQVATILHTIVQQQKPDLVVMGKQAIDDDCNQTGQMLAGLLDWPQATFASEIQFNDKQITVMREVDEGIETLQTQCPAVLTVDLRLNEPRFLSLPNIVKAKQKPLDIISLNDLNLDLQDSITILRVTAPATREKGIIVANVTELLQYLRDKEGLLA